MPSAWAAHDFTRPSVIRTWLEEAGIRPNRMLGQNFLIDGNILQILLDSCGITSGDRVLEVGPGLGAVTAGLLARGATVVALEKDTRLLPLLHTHLAGVGQLKLLQGDALSDAEGLLSTERIDKVVSNLPYTPGTRILVELATSVDRPAQIAVTVQDEVAGRITAEPGTGAFGLLGLWCGIYHEVRYVKRISPNCFWPRPQIRSAIVHLQRRDNPLLPREGWPFFQALTRRAFQQRRKQMGHLLAKDPGLTVADPVDMLPPAYQHARPEDLPIVVWCELSERLRLAGGSIEEDRTVVDLEHSHGG